MSILTGAAPLPPAVLKRRRPAADRPSDFRVSLENGDHLSREEFHRRYLLRPDIRKAELIDGIVYIMSSPARAKLRSGPHKAVAFWLSSYEVRTPGVDSWIDPTVRLGGENEPQPDAILRLPEACGGRSRIAADDYFEGPPELVVEISGSTVSKDLHEKKDVYRRAGVREYLVWRTEERALDWFRLDAAGRYQLIAPDVAGIIESAVFPGLRLAVAELLSGNLRAVLDELERGLASEAHRAFAAGLAGKRDSAG